MPENASETAAENGVTEAVDAAENALPQNKVMEKLKKKKSVKARKSEAHKPSEAAHLTPPQSPVATTPPQLASPQPLPRSPLPVCPNGNNGLSKHEESCDVHDEEADPLREGMATALFDYDPQENDELAFSEGAVLEVLEVLDDGWCTARDANGATGLVPGNYVKMLRTVITTCDGNETEGADDESKEEESDELKPLPPAASKSPPAAPAEKAGAGPEPPQHRTRGKSEGAADGKGAAAGGGHKTSPQAAGFSKGSDVVQVITPSMANQLVLNRGAVFEKLDPKHKTATRPRLVWVSGDHRVLWQEPTARNKKPKSARLCECEIRTDVSHPLARSGVCFSIVGPTESLDLQAQDRDERDFWVAQLRKQIEEALETERARRLIERSYQRDISVPERRRQWLQDILPGFQQMRMTQQCREVCWLGIPTNLRREVWSRCIGNQLQITKDLYEIFRNHASRARAEMEAKRQAALKEDATPEERAAWKGESHLLGSEASLKVIDKDLPRTFQQLAFFHNGGPLENQLRDVLEAYVFYRPDVGYVQGMSYLASMLLLNMDTCQSFIALANLLHSHYFLSFFAMDMTQIQIRFAVYEFFFESQLPVLYAHFVQLGVTTDTYLLNWLMTLFAKSLPLDVTTRIWDNYLLVGESFMIRAALGVLAWHADQFLRLEYEDIMVQLTHLHETYIDEDELFDAIRSVKVSAPHFDKVLQAQMEAQGLGTGKSPNMEDWHAHALDQW